MFAYIYCLRSKRCRNFLSRVLKGGKFPRDKADEWWNICSSLRKLKIGKKSKCCSFFESVLWSSESRRGLEERSLFVLGKLVGLLHEYIRSVAR